MDMGRICAADEVMSNSSLMKGIALEGSEEPTVLLITIIIPTMTMDPFFLYKHNSKSVFDSRDQLSFGTNSTPIIGIFQVSILPRYYFPRWLAVNAARGIRSWELIVIAFYLISSSRIRLVELGYYPEQSISQVYILYEQLLTFSASAVLTSHAFFYRRLILGGSTHCEEMQ
jgi:hypothetical protein